MTKDLDAAADSLVRYSKEKSEALRKIMESGDVRAKLQLLHDEYEASIFTTMANYASVVDNFGNTHEATEAVMKILDAIRADFKRLTGVP